MTAWGIVLPLWRDRSGRKSRQSGINERLRRHYRLIIKTGIGIASPATAGSQWHFPLCHYERRRSRSVVIRKGRVNRLWMLVRVRVMNFTGWGLPRSLCSLAMTAWGIALPLRRDRSGRKSCQSGINERLKRHYRLIIKTGMGIATSLRSSQWHIGDGDCPPATAGSQWHFPLCHYERRRSRSVVIRKGITSKSVMVNKGKGLWILRDWDCHAHFVRSQWQLEGLPRRYGGINDILPIYYKSVYHS